MATIKVLRTFYFAEGDARGIGVEYLTGTWPQVSRYRYNAIMPLDLERLANDVPGQVAWAMMEREEKWKG